MAFLRQGCNRRQRDQWPWSPRFPSPSPDHGFKSNRSSLSMASSTSSQSDHLDGSRCSRWGRRHQEETHMKINLPIFKDKDTKDAVTYQSWRWDLMVYWWTRCRDCTLLPYAIRSLQGYPGELVQSSGIDITYMMCWWFWMNIITTWKHSMHWIKSCSNCKYLIRRLCQTGVSASPDTYNYWQYPYQTAFPRSCSGTEEGLLLWWTSQMTKGDGGLP